MRLRVARPSAISAILCSLLLFATARAQTTNSPAVAQLKGDLSLGYSFASAGLGTGPRFNFHGFEFSGNHNLRPRLAIAYSEDYYWGSAVVPFCYSNFSGSCFAVGPKNAASLETLTAGLRFEATHGRATPFARALFGIAVLSACPLPGCESKLGYAQAFGGGLQVRITQRRFGWRFEGDLLETHLFGAMQNDFRFSTGPVFYFYKRR